jgi:hypothetical protein
MRPAVKYGKHPFYRKCVFSVLKVGLRVRQRKIKEEKCKEWSVLVSPLPTL